MEKLTPKDVEHVIKLARLKEDNIDLYETQLNDILGEIEKIMEINIEEKEMMISPSENKDRYSDGSAEAINREEVLNMANNKVGEFIVVSRVIND